MDNLLKEYNKLNDKLYYNKENTKYSYSDMIKLMGNLKDSFSEQNKFAEKFDKLEFLHFKQDIDDFIKKVKFFSTKGTRIYSASDTFDFFSMYNILLFDKQKVINIIEKPESWASFSDSNFQDNLNHIFWLLNQTYKEMGLDDCCHMKTTSKYLNRPGPPYAANELCCRGNQKVGNDSNVYISVNSKNNVWRWKKIKY